MNKKVLFAVLAALLVIAITVPVFAVDDALVAAAKEEGTLVSYGLPDSWANYGGIWKIYQELYGIERMDTDMGSGEIIQSLRAEAGAPVADITDLGLNYAKVVEDDNLSQPYKHSYWDELPDYAKSGEGLWSAGFWGAVAITVNKDLVKNVPTSFADLTSEEYYDSICIRDPRESATGIMAVMAMAFANGGSEQDPEPGIEFFGQLQKSGNLRYIKPNLSNIQKGECPISIHWDFDGLSIKEELSDMNIEVVIPSDGSFGGMYVQFITAGAPHADAAKLMIETMYSDEGQMEYAKGFCHPIRKIELPAELKEKFPSDEAYKAVNFPKNYLDLAAASDKIVEGVAKFF